MSSKAFVICVSGLAAVLALAGCHPASTPSGCEGSCVFTPGGAGDPVTRMAQAAITTTTDTVQLTFTNSTKASFSAGLITFSPLFQVGTTASQAFMNYVSDNGNAQGGLGNPNTLASAAGLTIGTNAFVVPSLKPGQSVTITIQVPSNVQLSYVADVNGNGDFVAINDAPLVGGSPGSNPSSGLTGYNAGGSGSIKVGNSSTGSSPPNTTIQVVDQSDCPSGSLAKNTSLFTDNFSGPVNTANWAKAAGYTGDFNGDWYTDGTTARVYNPNWGGAAPGAPIPTVTGFVKFIDVCPGASATLSVTANVTTQYSDPTSNTTLVVYFFDRGGAQLGVTTNYPAEGNTTRNFALYDATVPANTRHIAVVPMAYLALKEKGTVYYGNLAVSYEPAGAYTKTSIVAETFQSYSGPANTPTGWSTFNGDWFIPTGNKFVTLWNASWGGDQSKLPPIDTGLVQSFSLSGKYSSGDTITAQAFAAATFTDPNSFVRVRLVFNSPTGPFLESDRLNAGWGTVGIRRQPIPAGAVSVYAILNAYFGPTEKSSLYSNSFTVDTVHANPGF